MSREMAKADDKERKWPGQVMPTASMCPAGTKY